VGRNEKITSYMTALILEGKDEFLLKKIVALKHQNSNLPKIIIDNEETFQTTSFNQGGLFGDKTIIVLENFLRKRFQKILAKIKPQLDFHEWIFLEIIPKDNYKFQQYKKSFYLPDFLKNVKKQNIDRSSQTFSFWKKIADFLGTKISYQEWSSVEALLLDDISYLWTALEQKKLSENISLSELILSWSSGNVFHLAENLDAKKKQQALAILAKFKKQETKPEIIWYFLVRHFVQLYQIKRGLILDIHPYAFKKLKEEAENFTDEQLEEILAQLLDLDFKIKTGFFGSKEKIWEAINLFIFSYLFDAQFS